MCSESSRRGGLYSDRPKSEWADPIHLKDRGEYDRPRPNESPSPRDRSWRPRHSQRELSPDSSTEKRRARRSSSSRSRTRSRRDSSRRRSRSRSHSRCRRSRSRSDSRSRRRRHSSLGYKTKSSCSSTCSDEHFSEASQEEGEEESDEDNEDMMPRQKMEYYCEVCGIFATGFQELQIHFGGSKHNKNLKKAGYNTSFKSLHEVRDPQLQGKILRCLLCEMILSEAEVGYHVGSSTHIAALLHSEERFREMDPDKWFVEVTKQSGKTRSGYVCTLCEVTIPTFEGYEVHIRGKRHTKALRFSSHQDKLTSQATQYRCNICNISCTDQEALNTHLKGKRHLKTLKHKGFVPEDKPTAGAVGSSASPAASINPFAEAVVPSKIRCVLCDVVLSNSTETQAHLTTTKHYMELRKSSWLPTKKYKDMFVPA